MTDELGQFWQALLKSTQDLDEATQHAYQRLENAGLIRRVVVHRYVCREPGCGVRGTVIRIGGQTLLRTQDYKLSPGLNDRESVESARLRNTLDGNRHWPGHTYDVERMAAWGSEARISLYCRHALTKLSPIDVLAAVESVHPGRPRKPTLVG